MLDRPESGERCLLFHISVGRPSYSDEIAEFRALAASAGAEVVGEVRAQLTRPHPRYFAGAGKVAVDILAATEESTEGYLLVIDGALPLAANGLFGRAAGRDGGESTMYERAMELAEEASAILPLPAQRAALARVRSRFLPATQAKAASRGEPAV